jgi:hypothetical protein
VAALVAVAVDDAIGTDQGALGGESKRRLGSAGWYYFVAVSTGTLGLLLLSNADLSATGESSMCV